MAATRPRHSKEDFVAAGIHAALLLLLEAYEYAQELQRNHWDFAVALHTLRLAGLTESQLRWLVCRGYVEHAAEIAPAEKGRRFRRTGQLTFTDKTCVVLTELGASVARQVGQAHKRRSHPRDKAALAWRGDTIYERDVRPHLKAEDEGKFVAIDLETGAYEIGEEELAACDRLRARVPGAQIWLVRAGSRYLHRFGTRVLRGKP